MSLRYKGAVISATPPTTSSSGAAGSWTLQQQMQAQAGGNWPFGGPFTYIEDVFSTWLYTGNDSTQAISNGVDLNGNGGLVWLKGRSGGAYGGAVNHFLINSATGISNYLMTDKDKAQNGYGYSPMISSFNSNGFTLTNQTAVASTNDGSTKYVSWTFRKQPKFFDVVTYTGNGSNAGQLISHSLGSVPGCIIVKRTSGDGNWGVYIKPTGGTSYSFLRLNTTDSQQTTVLQSNMCDSTTFYALNTGNNSTGNASDNFNLSGSTYVAYLFAHNAGGFGLTGTDNVISCGSFDTGASGKPTIDLGYEPQWVLIKKTNATGDWLLQDTMREMSQTNLLLLTPNTADNENNFGAPYVVPTATGFTFANNYIGTNATGIYIAIRRGPMKTPTSGTSVFAPVTYTGTGATRSLTAGFPIDLALFKVRDQTLTGFNWFDRLRGTTPDLRSSGTFAELATTTEVTSFASNTQVTVGASSDTNGTNANGYTYVLEAFSRAPGFFDEVCYTGDGSASRAITHNLGVAPEFIIVKPRSVAGNWRVATAFTSTDYLRSVLNLNGATNTVSYSGDNTFPAQPTATTFTVGNFSGVNGSGNTYVSYLFATCPGVSKVGTYTGTGAAQTINCGFTSGARFVLIKGPDDGNDNWYVYDSARGITSGNDPYLFMNSTAAEVTNTNYVDADSTGFKLTSSAPSSLNTNGSVYIFIAIA